MSALKEVYSPEETVAMAEAFRQLEDMPGWRALVTMVEGMKEQVIRAGLAAYRDPPEIAFNAGLEHGLSVLLGLPAQFVEGAKKIRDEEAQVERLDAEAKNRLRRRATTEGEVAL